MIFGIYSKKEYSPSVPQRSFLISIKTRTPELIYPTPFLTFGTASTLGEALEVFIV